MVLTLWFNMSMIPYFCRFQSQILEMFSKSLLHIIFNKWTFIDLMSNLMAICVTWKIWSWNYIHIVNSFTLILWNSSNYVSILLIKFGFTVLHFTTIGTLFAIVHSAFGKSIVFCLVTSIGSTPLDILIP